MSPLHCNLDIYRIARRRCPIVLAGASSTLSGIVSIALYPGFEMAIKGDDALGLAEGLEGLLEDPAFDPAALDYSTRRRLSEAARKLSLATEAPGDTVHRIAHTVRLTTRLSLLTFPAQLFPALRHLLRNNPFISIVEILTDSRVSSF